MSGISPNLEAVLASNFDKPVPQEFWHHMAKKYHKGPTYHTEATSKRVEEIRAKLGECSFNRQAAYGLTPLHVAVLSNNREGVRFFLSQGARVDIQNEEGKTPAEYAFHSKELMELFSTSSQWKKSVRENPIENALPEMDKIFSKAIADYERGAIDPALRDPAQFKLAVPVPAAKPSIARSVLSRLLPPVIALPSSAFTYQENTNDFGTEIQDLLVIDPKLSSSSSGPNYVKLQIPHVVHGLSKIADEEGFRLTFTKTRYYPRDAFIRTASGVTTFAKSSSHLKQAIDRAESKAAYFEESAFVCARMRCLAGGIGSSGNENHLRDPVQFPSFRHPKLPAYIEGGNLFTLTNAKGKRKVLIGKDHLAQIHAQLRLEKYFESNPPLPLDDPLSQEDVRKVAEEMYAMGLLSTGSGKEKTSGYISEKMMANVLSEFYRKQTLESPTFREIAFKQGLVPFHADEQGLNNARPLAEKYAAQKKASVNALAQELEADPENLHFIPQVAYHLDIFMQPGPKGSIFLQDFSQCIHILEQLQAVDNFTALNLCLDDRFMLARYLATAKHLKTELELLLMETRRELETAGFIVIPTPGIFFDQHYELEDRTFHLNFLNAVTGWSEKQHRYFYITTGVNAGTHLGTQLMHFFSLFLKQYERDLKVHFIGENPAKRGDFSQAMELWNQVGNENVELGAMAGIHCMSVEKAMKSHAV